MATLRKRPADLIIHANQLIEAVTDALPAGKKLLVVVEDLDKLDINQARDIYVRQTGLLTGIRTNIIYTIPIFLFHSPDVDAFKHSFDDTINLPMIKVFEPGKEGKLRSVKGCETVREIILQRISNELIEEKALEELILKTGGVLRHTFSVLESASLMADVKPPLTKEHIEYGLSRLKKNFWQQITLPYDKIPGGPATNDELYDRLKKYAKDQKAGKKIAPRTDAINQILLKVCAIVEYNGEGWFGVHPLVIENLEVQGYI